MNGLKLSSSAPARTTAAGMAAACGALLAALLTLGSGAARAQAAESDGARAYEKACASCHRIPSRVIRPFVRLPPAERQARLDAFLKTHHAPDDAQRAAIVSWLEQQAGGR